MNTAETVPPRIFLVGLSGSGKSTLARRAARRLGWEVRDTDQMVVERAGLSIAEIFERMGEQEFRRLERKALSETLALERVVVATGGGMMIDERNRADMLGHGLVAYIKKSPENCARNLQRSRRGEVRPLLQGEGGLEARLRELLAERAVHYEQAHVILEAGARGLEELAAELVEMAGGATPRPGGSPQ